MAKSLSPLRYPGGKAKIYDKVKNLIESNNLGNKTYVEPFAGGFGIGIALLYDKMVDSVILNDFDRHIYHFWQTVIYHTDDLLKRITETPITLDERERQRKIYKDPDSDAISDGFATLFLNRVNYSGVLQGGPIGGLDQTGDYKIDCRFNKDEISKKISAVASIGDKIQIYNYDVSVLITEHLRDRIPTMFFNIDPPYVEKGQKLYTNFFREDDHRRLEGVIANSLNGTEWIITYDNCDLIKEIYRGYHMEEYDIQHNARKSIIGKEIVITNIPQEHFVW